MTTPGTPPGFSPMAFTCRANARSLRLVTEVEIFPASTTPVQGKTYQALYDTGATHSSVSPKVIADLQLQSIGAISVHVGGGTLPTTAHLVNIGLPNRVMFQMWRVSKVELHGGIDVLIGMDILGVGDFAVTHHGDKTMFSFCVPSRKEIDFVAEITTPPPPASSNKISRNSRCTCGSGKKYKKCCGA